MNRKLFPKADNLGDKILSGPRIKLSNSQILILDGFETGNFPSDFAQQLSRKNEDIPDIYFTLLDAAGISLSLINLKRERKLGPFQNLNVRTCKCCTHRVVLLLGPCATL